MLTVADLVTRSLSNGQRVFSEHPRSGSLAGCGMTRFPVTSVPVSGIDIAPITGERGYIIATQRSTEWIYCFSKTRSGKEQTAL